MDNKVMQRAHIETLKKQIHENIGVNDGIICELCDQLIKMARTCADWEGVAFGYVWRADYQFYVAADMAAATEMLDLAQQYIDPKQPSELLEKFYTMQHVLAENLFDLHAAFRYTLKALEVAETINIPHRIGANYGNLGTYYLDCGCYAEALFYSKKAVAVFKALPESHARLLRILLTNLVLIYLKLKQLDQAKAIIEELSRLPLAEKDLKIYVDYGYTLYYAAVHDPEQSLYYCQQMLADGLMTFPSRAFIIEFLSNILEAMLYLRNKTKALELLQALEQISQDDGAQVLLMTCKLKIRYAQQFGTKTELAEQYRAYFKFYLQVREKNNELKVGGFRAKVRLDASENHRRQSRKELQALHDLVHYDELTKVYNRRYLTIKQDELINNYQLKQLGFAIFDVDYFKEYNDSYGHPAGDEVLKTVATCLRENVGEQTAIFRYGGDEFVALSWAEDAQALASDVAKIAKALEEKPIVHAYSRCAQRVTLSIGYGSRSIANQADAFILFDEVDRALYRAKHNGRNNAQEITEA